ncbi:MAG: DMT family protein [Polyangiaceae bacterium]|nr:DMT family protein [Polyangiaceae bacterium]
MLAIPLLFLSNIFMTYAWYGHLKHKEVPLLQAILVSWGIAFFEYCLMVPANRFGSARFATAELKVMQEAISLVVFAGFSVWFLREPLKWNYIVSFVLILGAVFFAFKKW